MAGISLLTANRRVLMVGEDGIVLFACSGKSVTREGALPWSLPNFNDQLTALLSRQNKSHPLMVLFDAIEQAYKRELLPKVSSLDLPKILRRKLEMAFPTYPVRASLKLKEPKSKDDDDRGPSYLFAALPDIAMLENVAKSLYEAEVRISGFALLPVETVDMVTEIAKKAQLGVDGPTMRWRVLISQHETGGLRQIVVRGGQLVLTRMTQISEAGMSGGAWVDEVLREFRASLSYLARLKYTASDGLDVIVVCGDEEKNIFAGKQAMLQTARLLCLTPAEATALIGLTSSGDAKPLFGDALHAGWMGKKSAAIMPVSIPSITKTQKPRALAQASIAGLALLLLLQTAVVLYYGQDYLGKDGEVEEKRSQQSILQQEYDSELVAYNALPVKALNMRSVMSVKKMLEGNTVHVGRLMEVVRRSLDPAVVLENIRLEHKPGAALIAGPRGAVRKAPTPGSKEDVGEMVASFSYLLPDGMSLEQKVLHAEDLVRKLRETLPGYQVDIVSQFGNVSRTGRFTGQAGGATAQATGHGAAEIAIKGGPL